MTSRHDSVDDALGALCGRHRPDSDHMNQLEKQLMTMQQSRGPGSFVQRHRIITAVLCMMILAGGAAAAHLVLSKQKLYDFRISRDEELISQPRILVEEGQEATITVGSVDEDGNVDGYSITVGPDGEIIYEVPDDVDVDVSVEEIEVDDEGG